jgi:uroporphyrinogen decarboxylase
MTSKERAKIAMSGGTPDRVPVIPQICPPHAIKTSGKHFEKTIVDLLKNPRKYDLIVAECAKNYGVDGCRVWEGAEPVNIEWDGDAAYEVDSDTGERTGMVDFKGGGGVLVPEALQRKLTEEDIEAIEVVDADELINTVSMTPTKEVIKNFGDDLFIIGVPSFFTVEMMIHTQGLTSTLTDIIDRPEFIRQMSERQLEASIQKAIAMAKCGVDAFYIGETLGQFMSPDQFNDLVAPYFQKFVDELRPYGPLIYIHMCGRITHLVDEIAKISVDCLEPMDVVGGTSVSDVKQRMNGKMAVMGGVSTLLLAHGTVDEVYQDAVRCIDEAKGEGGYLLAACDMLPTETTPEKVAAMLEVAETKGRYSS